MYVSLLKIAYRTESVELVIPRYYWAQDWLGIVFVFLNDITKDTYTKQIIFIITPPVIRIDHDLEI